MLHMCIIRKKMYNRKKNQGNTMSFIVNKLHLNAIWLCPGYSNNLVSTLIPCIISGNAVETVALS